MKRLELVGQKFGRLTVIKFIGIKEKHTFWECICNCGAKVVKVNSNKLRRGIVRSCGCIRRKYVGGERIGKLVVVSFAHIKKGQTYWNCLCDCGNKTIVSTPSLWRNRTRSCGCLSHELSAPTIVGFNLLYAIYTTNAKKRNYKFDLSENEFRNLTSSDCFYCGTKPMMISKLTSKKHPKKVIDNSKYIYNGIDRMDSKKGYTVSNCVPCCWDCNNSKMVRTFDEFKTWVEKVYRHICI